MFQRLIGASAMLVGVSLSGAPAQASFLLTLTEQGGNVVEAGSGTLDLSALTFGGPGGSFSPVITPNIGSALSGSTTPSGSIDTYTGFVGPLSFGTGPESPVGDSGGGDSLGIFADQSQLFVPHGYIFGGLLSTDATFDNQTFASLGVTPGVYEWTWGSGNQADSFTLDIGAPVPEPGTWALMLAGFAGLGALALRRGDWRCA